MSTTSLSAPLRGPVLTAGPAGPAGPWRIARLTARKDLTIERGSRVVVAHVIPFGVLVLLAFAFALDPDRGVLTRAAPGLFWTTVVLSSLTTAQRSLELEREDGALDSLRLAGVDLRGVFLGKVAAVGLQLLVVEAVLLAGMTVLYGASLTAPLPLIASAVPATAGIALVGTLFASVTSGLRSRSTAQPLLLLPTITPVLLGATRVWESAFDVGLVNVWSWVALLWAFACVVLAAVLLLIEPLLEEV